MQGSDSPARILTQCLDQDAKAQAGAFIDLQATKTSLWPSSPSPPRLTPFTTMRHVLSPSSAPRSLPWGEYTAPGVYAGTGLQLRVSGQAAGISAPAIILLLTQ